MHQAYLVHSILKQDVQIESIAAFGIYVILGTRNGQLIMYSVDEQQSVDMVMFNSPIGKKAITQMEVVPAENLLIVLTDGMIHVCDISRLESNFTLIHQAAETKGCTLFAVDVKSETSTTGESATVIRICCAIKRRLQFYYWYWKNNMFKSLSIDLELKDVPKSLCWLDDVICVGYKDEYILFDISPTPPDKYELIVTSSTFSIEPRICQIRDKLLGVSKDEYLVIIDPCNKIKPKDAKQIGNENAINQINNASIIKPLKWSSPLHNIVWDEPYAIGRVNNNVEVRCLEGKDTLVQTIPELQKTKYLVRAAKGTIFAAAASELWCIRLADIPTQRQQLLQQKKFQLAIELTQITKEDVEVLRELHMLYARELFTNKQFAEAMLEFEKADIDPYDVIRLFPTLVPEQKLSAQDASVPTVSAPQLDDRDLENAHMALIDFLVRARQRVKVRETKSNKPLLEIIDTTLLKCYLQTNDSLVAPLLRLGQCHLEESEKSLKKHNKIAELIILYQTNGKHKKALELLKAQANVEGSVLQGHERTVRYLQALGADHLSLIFEFADWVLTEDPEKGLLIFTDKLIEVETLPRANVLDFLLSKHKILVIPYLEHIINEWGDTNTQWHNLLIKQYKDKLLRLMAENAASEATAELRAKLYALLADSSIYTPEPVLEDFPTTVLLEERALILGRLKKHEKVLAIYIQVLGDMPKALAYCEANYADNEEIYIDMLKLILSPLPQPPYEGVSMHADFLRPNREVALEILNKYATKINPVKVFPYLPDDLPMTSLQHYMDKAMRKQLAEKHHTEMMRGLLEAELARLELVVKQHESVSFELNENSMCPLCRKKFSSQVAFVRYPNGQLVHLSCHDRNTVSQ